MVSKRSIIELQKLIKFKSNEYKDKGFQFVMTGDTVDKFESIRGRKTFLVSTVGANSAILGYDTNILLRFWHDCVHIELDLDYSYVNEGIVIQEQVRQLKNLGISKNALDVFRADMLGQNLYYKVHKKFVRDQAGFVNHIIAKGVYETLLSGDW